MQLTSIATLAEMLRPRATSTGGGGSSTAGAIAVSVFTVLLMLGVIALAIFVIRTRGKQMREVGARALAPLGLVAQRWGMTGWRSKGAVSGRPLSIVLAPEQRYSPSQLTVEVASGASFDASVGPAVPASAAWLRSMISSGAEVPVPGFPPRSIHSDDPRRAHAVAEARSEGIQRMLAPLVAGQQRWLFVRRGHVKLQIVGEAWQTLSPASLRADVDELVAVAAAAERA